MEEESLVNLTFSIGWRQKPSLSLSYVKGTETAVLEDRAKLVLHSEWGKVFDNEMKAWSTGINKINIGGWFPKIADFKNEHIKYCNWMHISTLKKAVTERSWSYFYNLPCVFEDMAQALDNYEEIASHINILCTTSYSHWSITALTHTIRTAHFSKALQYLWAYIDKNWRKPCY